MFHFGDNLDRSTHIVVMALVMVGVFGCAPATGSISGTVTYQGKPLPHGRVTFVCADGTVVSGKIASDGSYTIPQAPVGRAKVAVRCLEEAMPTLVLADPSELPGAKGTGSSTNVPRTPMMVPSALKPKSKPTVFRIPDHYQEAEKSGLTYEIQQGNQTHNIKLEE